MNNSHPLSLHTRTNSSSNGLDIEEGHLCSRINNLPAWTEYGIGVRGWANHKISMAALPVTTTTRSDCKFIFLFNIKAFVPLCIIS